MRKNFVVIGKSNTGKSGLMDEIVENKDLKPIGFRMHSISVDNEFKGYYMESLKDVEGYHNRVPVQTVLKSKHRINLTEVYDTFGVACLDDVLNLDKEEYDCVILDELGRGEAASEKFSDKIYEILDGDEMVFVLMKNVNNDVTSTIKKRNDVYLYDLDNMSQDEVYKDILDKVDLCRRATR